MGGVGYGPWEDDQGGSGRIDEGYAHFHNEDDSGSGIEIDAHIIGQLRALMHSKSY